MELFDREDLEQLARAEDDVCISLYMPTIRFESELAQNPIRYKNLLRAARKQLTSQGYRDDGVDALLETARRQLDDTSFWRGMSEGLAAFITSTSCRFYRLPLPFEEVVVCGDRFHLKPLFPLIATNNRYYVLALNKNKVQLYQGTHHALSNISSTDIPANIVDAFRQYEEAEQDQPISAAVEATRMSQNGASQNPDAAVSDEWVGPPHVALRRFFEEVDRSVRARLDSEQAPLVVAGVKDYLQPYRAANTYPHLIKDPIGTTHPDQLKMDALHDRSWKVVETVFLDAQDDALEQFNVVYHTDGDMASDDFHEIVPAAVFSRVDTLFVPIGHHRWGHYDASSNAVEVHDEQQPGDEDLLNYAAVHAYLNGATVHALRPENMPNGLGLAATFRYITNVSASEQ